jgi:hypothetical protein
VDDTVSKAFTALAGAQLKVIDDIGLLPISADAAEGLYRLVDAAYEKRSLALSTNIHPSGFDQLMDKTALQWPSRGGELSVLGALSWPSLGRSRWPLTAVSIGRQGHAGATAVFSALGPGVYGPTRL